MLQIQICQTPAPGHKGHQARTCDFLKPPHLQVREFIQITKKCHPPVSNLIAVGQVQLLQLPATIC
uniref:Uncharacterized protein n=1 Tax=Rhizophora mucronata TaxID=61149 RepID=A0A2P2NJJ8_RHIMU